KVLVRIESLLQKQRTQAAHMQRNDEHLGELISGLQTAIARQAELARQAEEKRKAEEAHKAEQARKAALEQRREIERQRAAARQAEQQAQAAQARARRAQDEHAAEQARLQVEQARDQSRKADQAARASDLAKTKSANEAASAASSHKTAAGSFAGLKKGLPYPVSGEIQGMFGAQRPDGGRWRGIVLRAPEGTAVRAIAPGRVVYANWLSGFGNIMIIDHGANYLSVYGYNQSLLKRVGDIVAAGETVATVGATGGQVESGLYFEIRHQGSPVNPSLWLGH
ncbi:MAG: peptidoglycan DD-metalloendopeptidase family protein, partial [Burkholderiaceae bacterium]